MPRAAGLLAVTPTSAEVDRIERMILSQLRDIERKLEDDFVTDASDALDDLRISVRAELGRLKSASRQGAQD
jgi:hypothetical protein